MSGNPMYILGVISGLLLVVAVSVAIYFATGQHKRPCKFDERQALARFKAYRAAFWTLVAYLCLNGFFVSTTDQHWGDAIVEPFLGICIAATVFATLCIFYDAYFALNEKRRFYMWLFAFVAVSNGALAIININNGEMLTNGVLNFHVMNFIVLVMFLILFAALTLKAILERRARVE